MEPEATPNTYKLIFSEKPTGDITKNVGEDVFFSDLPADYKVYAFYYGGGMSNEVLTKKLRDFGDATGKNLFVNIAGLKDPKLDEMMERFEIKNFPVIIVTAVDSLASPGDEYLTAFARLDNKSLLNSPERTVECVQQLFTLFLQGKVKEAMSASKWKQRSELLKVLGNFIATALKGLKDFIVERDISFSVLQGKFELKKHGG